MRWIVLCLLLSSCQLSYAVRPIGGVSEEDLEQQAQAIERAFKVVDARLTKLEGEDE